MALHKKYCKLIEISKMNEKVHQLAKMIDHSILHPTLTDEDLKRECEVSYNFV